jgi:hypothetical protein
MTIKPANGRVLTLSSVPLPGGERRTHYQAAWFGMTELMNRIPLRSTFAAAVGEVSARGSPLRKRYVILRASHAATGGAAATFELLVVL